MWSQKKKKIEIFSQIYPYIYASCKFHKNMKMLDDKNSIYIKLKSQRSCKLPNIYETG